MSKPAYVLANVLREEPFEVITHRYQHVATDQAFAEWCEILANASSAVAFAAHLTHQAKIIPIEGASYRRKESRERTEKRVTHRTDKKRTKKA